MKPVVRVSPSLKCDFCGDPVLSHHKREHVQFGGREYFIHSLCKPDIQRKTLRALTTFGDKRKAFPNWSDL